MRLISSRWFWFGIVAAFLVAAWPISQQKKNVPVAVHSAHYSLQHDTIAELAAILSGDSLPPPPSSHLWYIAEKVYGTAFWSDHVSARLLARLVYIESRGDSLAVSSVGAQGLGQIRPEFWLGEFPECGDDLRRVRDNLCYTVRILSYYKKRSPTLHAALLLYNGCQSQHCSWYARAVADDD